MVAILSRPQFFKVVYPYLCNKNRYTTTFLHIHQWLYKNIENSIENIGGGGGGGVGVSGVGVGMGRGWGVGVVIDGGGRGTGALV